MTRGRPANVTIAIASILLLIVVVARWDATVAPLTAQTGACTNGVAVPDPSSNPGLVSDCEALLEARDTLRGTEQLNWSVSRSVNTWTGITVDGAAQRVTEIDLSYSELNGSIPAALGNLSSLVKLDLAFNELTDSIPTELGDLSDLEVLKLKANELSGVIPEQLGDLSNLKVLDLGRNYLTGPIPSELSSLGNLEELVLSRVRFAGPIPGWVGNMTNLRVLDLSGCQLVGPLPTELLSLGRLEDLDLSGNPLAGPIPAWLGSLDNLKHLDLSRSQLNGTIPSELSNLSRLWSMRLAGNQLSGQIPTELVGLSSLLSLGLSRNQLTGQIPSEIGALSNLRWLDLSKNQLTGSIPASLEDISELSVLHLSGNNLTGCIPDELLEGPSSDLHLLGLPPCTALPITGPFISSIRPGMGSLSINWRAPRRVDGPPITSYDLRYIETQADETVESDWTSLEGIWQTGFGALAYELTGLTNETQYDLQLRAINAVGPGPWSAVVNGTPTADDLPPLSPGNVWHRHDGSSVVVSWDASPEATHYRVYHDRSIDLNCGSGSADRPSSCEELAGNVTATTFVHTGADQSENYYWIVACNIVGCSELDLVNPSMFVASAPSAPAITSMSGEVGSLFITWSAPTQADGSAVFSYDLRHIETSADETTESNWTTVDEIWTTGSGALIYDLAGLADRTQYDVQLRAANPVGDGPWSETFTEVAGIPATVSAIRSISHAHVQPGGKVVVTITTTGLGVLSILSETFPAGFSYVSSDVPSGFVTVSNRGLQVTLIGSSTFEYTVTASTDEGSYSFSGSTTAFDFRRWPVTGASSLTVQAAPSVEIAHSAGGEAPLVRPDSPIAVTVTFSEPVFAFTVDDINSINGSIDNLVGSDGDVVFMFDVTPNGLGEVMVDVPADVAVDANGNSNTPAPQLSLGLPYDDDRDGVIHGDEILIAVSDYFNGVITGEQILAMVRIYFSSVD